MIGSVSKLVARKDADAYIVRVPTEFQKQHEIWPTILDAPFLPFWNTLLAFFVAETTCDRVLFSLRCFGSLSLQLVLFHQLLLHVPRDRTVLEILHRKLPLPLREAPNFRGVPEHVRQRHLHL